MNKEEIVKYIKEQIDKCYVIEHKNFEEVDLSKLLDYITNLQKENKELLLELSGYREAILKNDDLLGLQERINKAIDYIKGNACYGIQENCCLDDLNYDECDELLEILKGDE